MEKPSLDRYWRNQIQSDTGETKIRDILEKPSLEMDWRNQAQRDN